MTEMCSRDYMGFTMGYMKCHAFSCVISIMQPSSNDA